MTPPSDPTNMIYLIPHVQSSDVIELDDVFYVLGLTMNLFFSFSHDKY